MYAPCGADRSLKDEINRLCLYMETGRRVWSDVFHVMSVHECWDNTVARMRLMLSVQRGWTTWLLGCVDSRVFAMAPTVFDLLNFQEVSFRLIYRFIDWLIDWPANQDTNRSTINRSIIRWIDQSIQPSTNQSIKQAINQSIKGSTIDRTINQRIDWSFILLFVRSLVRSSFASFLRLSVLSLIHYLKQ